MYVISHWTLVREKFEIKTENSPLLSSITSLPEFDVWLVNLKVIIRDSVQFSKVPSDRYGDYSAWISYISRGFDLFS